MGDSVVARSSLGRKDEADAGQIKLSNEEINDTEEAVFADPVNQPIR